MFRGPAGASRVTTECEVMGFDCRRWGRGLEGIWEAERRSSFLLVPTVATPLSVDQMSWPSVFDTDAGYSLPRAERRKLGLAGFRRPAYVGPHAPFWSELAELKAELAKHRINPGESKLIQAIRCDGTWSVELTQKLLAPGFEPVGFDVADLGFTSALTNCGYEHDEQLGLRIRFSSQLNQFHLFANWKPASEFAASAQELVPEHAPFAPYLMAWLVDG